MDFYWITVVVIVVLYLYAKWNSNYFKRRGVKNVPYSIPFIGNMFKTMTQQEHFSERIYEAYNMFPDQKYVGHMQFNQPLIMIRDLEVLKQAFIKDFDHFLSHFSSTDGKTDPLIGNNIFSLNGDKWRDMRATLSPAFTSSKVKNMFIFVEETARDMIKHYLEEMKKPENTHRGLVEVELRDVFTRYTNDVIATSVFGIKVNSFEDRENDFYNQGRAASDFSGKQFFKFFFMMPFPKLMKIFQMSHFDPSMSNYFRNLVLGNMKERIEKNIFRPDMIHLLIEAKKGALRHEANVADEQDAGFATVKESQVGKEISKRSWTDDEIIAQAVIFFLAGFDTSSLLLCFMSHELALHPDIQKKLQKEVDDVIAKHGPILNYTQLNEMKYMDMVVSETLRLWPPAAATDRKCTKAYTLPPPNDKSPSYRLEAGDSIWVPIYGIHHDPMYYPNPKKFDPERFSDENKHKILPMTFIPFGIGPRNCIGSRFALMEAKAAMFHLLSKFDFVEIAKTQNPLILAKDTFTLHASKGFWVGLKPRSSSAT